MAAAFLVLDAGHRLVERTRLVVQGLVDPEVEADLVEDAIEAADRAFNSLPKGARGNDGRVREAVSVAIRRSFNRAIGKKPVTEVQVLRLP